MAREQAKTEAAQKGTRYAVGKRFISGLLRGLHIVDRHCPPGFDVGEQYGGTFGSAYIVTSCEQEPA